MPKRLSEMYPDLLDGTETYALCKSCNTSMIDDLSPTKFTGVRCVICGSHLERRLPKEEVDAYLLNTKDNTSLFKLGDAFFENLEIDTDCEFGSIGLNPKRPFGNSDVEDDILEIVEVEPLHFDDCQSSYSWEQKNYARDLYFIRLIPFLQACWGEYRARTRETRLGDQHGNKE